MRTLRDEVINLGIPVIEFTSAVELIKDEKRMVVVPLRTKYPQGGERQLIYACTKRAINAKMLPADAGCIVDNVETLCAIYNAVALGIPVMNRIFTVTGGAVCEPRNYEMYMGTSFEEFLEESGGFIKNCEKMIAGGPMMGFALQDAKIPTTKTTSALVCLDNDEAAKYKTTACINCGRCVEACPEQLVPSKLAKFAETGRKEEFKKWYGLECVECGSCTFMCPARRHLAQGIKTMKKQIMAEMRAKK